MCMYVIEWVYRLLSLNPNHIIIIIILIYMIIIIVFVIVCYPYGGSATPKNPVRYFKYFKQFMARFQDFRALEIDVRNNSIT